MLVDTKRCQVITAATLATALPFSTATLYAFQILIVGFTPFQQYFSHIIASF
jgi:hypothetical protein